MKLRQIFRKCYYEFTGKFLYNFFRLFKIKTNTVIAESFFGLKTPDNILPIVDQIKEKYKVYYVTSSHQKFKVPGCIMVRRMSPQYFYILATTNYILTNSRMTDYLNKRRQQVYIQLWHGTPLKKMGHDMVGFQMPNENKIKHLKNFDNDVRQWDYLISPNSYATKCFRSAFGYNGKILEVGYPRNERLYKSNEFDIKNLKKKLNIDLNKEVILYTPTYREHNYDNGYRQDLEIDFEALSLKFPNTVFLVRLHYLIQKKYDISKFKNIIDVSSYPDINDLYIISDKMITDYSSTMFDYMILKRPIILYTYDYNFYKTELRGFYLELEELGLKIAYNNKELYEIIGMENKDSILSQKDFLSSENSTLKIVETIF